MALDCSQPILVEDMVNEINGKAQQIVLDDHIGDKNNPHSVTAAQIGTYESSDFISVSTGPGDGGKPIILDPNGKIDSSMLDISVFYYAGKFTPTSGSEYPDTSNESPGAFWVVENVDETNGYTFTSGDLSGKTVNNGDFMVWGENGWSIMNSSLDPSLYYKLDGSKAITAPFAGGGQQLKNIAPGTENGDAVEFSQISSFSTDFLRRDGSLALTDNFDGGSFQLKNIKDASDPQDALTKIQFDNHTHQISDISNLQSELDSKVSINGDTFLGNVSILSNNMLFKISDSTDNTLIEFYDENNNRIGYFGKISGNNADLFLQNENGNIEIIANMGDLVVNGENVSSHITNTSNPHSVTASQVGAASQNDFDSHINANNPHNITVDKIGAAWENHGHKINEVENLQNSLDKKVNSDTSIVANSNKIENMVFMTQNDYDSLGSYDDHTFYVIVQ